MCVLLELEVSALRYPKLKAEDSLSLRFVLIYVMDSHYLISVEQMQE